MKAADSLSRLWNGFFFKGSSEESLGLLRIAIGCGLLVFHVSQFGAIVFSIDPFGPGFRFTWPMWHFELLGIDYHVPWLTPIVFVTLMLATLAMTLGRNTRSAIVVMILCIFYLKGVRDSFAGDVHHRYLMPMQMLFFLLLSRCGDVISLDARRAARRQPLAEWEASWPSRAMQLYVASFYFWGALAKLRESGLGWFIGGGKIQEILLERAVRWGGVDLREVLINPLTFEIAQSPLILHTLGAVTFVMELGFPLILLVKSVRHRMLFFFAISGFHLANFALLGVNFLMIPIVFLVFFDLVPIRLWFRERFGRKSSGESGIAGQP